MKKFLIYFYLIFGTSFTPIAARYVVQEISPLSLAFIRFGVAAILFLIIFLFRKNNFRIDKKDIPMLLVVSALVIPINQFFFLKGISLSTASHSGVIYACTPLFAFFISLKLKTEKFSYKKLFSIFVTIAGIFVIFYENILKTFHGDSTYLIGDIFLFFAVFSWAGYLTLSKELVKKYGTVKVSTMAFLIGLLMYIPLFLSDCKNLTFKNLDLIGWLGFFQLSVMVAFGSYFVFVYASKFVQISSLTISLNTSPIVTIIFSWILLKEELSYFFVIGSVITIGGVLFNQIFDNVKISLNN